MPHEGAYGDAIGESFHLKKVPSLTMQTRPGVPLSVTHVVCGEEGLGKTAALAPEPAYLIPILLKPLVHELWFAGRPVPVEPWPTGALSIVDMEQEPTAYFGGPLDSVQLYLPRSSIAAIAEESDTRTARDIVIPHGTVDPITHRMALLLLPAFEHPEQANQLFLSGLMLAMYAHLIHTYGNLPAHAPHVCSMTNWQLSRAREIISENLSGRISVAEVAFECGMSADYFSRAFRRATGLPPHQWLLHRRVQVAKALLEHEPISIAEVAFAAGFADQSHLVRVFGRIEGTTPSAWRLARSHRPPSAEASLGRAA